MSRTRSAAAPVRLGIRANLAQFVLLVGVNALVGGMVGQERTVVPLLASRVFHLNAFSVALSFIVVFGAVKAVTNLFAGTLSDRFGRKPVLVAGWLIGLPVPLLVIWAPSWAWIVAANVLLGVNQGLTWSTTVIMKIDLAGPERRGLAMGLNEASGYGAVAVTALLTGLIAKRAGLRPEPFILGLSYAALGLGLSTLAVRETRGHAALEAVTHVAPTPALGADLAARDVFVLTSLREPALSACSQAGLVNNLNDGVAWGLFPLMYAAGGLSVAAIGTLAAIYPAVWGLGQLVTGALSDRIGRKWLIAGGMWARSGSRWMRPAATAASASARASVGSRCKRPRVSANQPRSGPSPISRSNPSARASQPRLAGSLPTASAYSVASQSAIRTARAGSPRLRKVAYACSRCATAASTSRNHQSARPIPSCASGVSSSSRATSNAARALCQSLARRASSPRASDPVAASTTIDTSSQRSSSTAHRRRRAARAARAVIPRDRGTVDVVTALHHDLVDHTGQQPLEVSRSADGRILDMGRQPGALTLSEDDRRVLAVWAADCAERTLPLFEAQAPNDTRPREAIDGLRAFARGEMRIGKVRTLAARAHAAAREIRDPAAVAAAWAAGQAAAVAHMAAHARGAAA